MGTAPCSLWWGWGCGARVWGSEITPSPVFQLQRGFSWFTCALEGPLGMLKRLLFFKSSPASPLFGVFSQFFVFSQVQVMPCGDPARASVSLAVEQARGHRGWVVLLSGVSGHRGVSRAGLCPPPGCRNPKDSGKAGFTPGAHISPQSRGRTREQSRRIPAPRRGNCGGTRSTQEPLAGSAAGLLLKSCGHSLLMKPHPREGTAAVTSPSFTRPQPTPQRDRGEAFGRITRGRREPRGKAQPCRPN